ncbi:hypothetical protein MIR68_011075 [Amoeboaphelidium protococcarum]|nr:hypothetical protein MIR68_011075 [Amoeboaphelidium protococcarum]
MRQILLIGDSLTQRSFDVNTGGWASLMANDYARKAQIVNQGYGGYNSEWLRCVIDHLLQDLYNVHLVIIFIGTNDAVLPNLPNGQSKQHVFVQRYKSNLQFIIDRVKLKLPGSEIILISPTLFDEAEWTAYRDSQGKVCDRSNINTALYSNACMDITPQVNATVNLIKAFQYYDGPPRDLFTDGLHFSRLGNQLLYEELDRVIRQSLPHVHHENLRPLLPHHSEVPDQGDPRDFLQTYACQE